MNRGYWQLLLLAGTLISVAPAARRADAGTVVPTRVELAQLLGPAAVTEDFQSFAVPASEFREFEGSLDSAAVKLGQGPGLVEPGIRFNVYPIGQLQWYGTQVFGGDSQRLSFSLTDAYGIDFSPPVRGAGLDLTSLEMLSGTANVRVFDNQGSQIAHFASSPIASPTEGTFVGYFHADGISRIEITTFEGGPILDDLIFAPVAEPTAGTLALGLAGVVQRVARRRITRGRSPAWSRRRTTLA